MNRISDICRNDIVSGGTRIKRRWRAIARSVVAVTRDSSEGVCASSCATRAESLRGTAMRWRAPSLDKAHVCLEHVVRGLVKNCRRFVDEGKARGTN